MRDAKELHFHNQAYTGLGFRRRIEGGRILYDFEIMRCKKILINSHFTTKVWNNANPQIAR
jgi:hypothetical protein